MLTPDEIIEGLADPSQRDATLNRLWLDRDEHRSKIAERQVKIDAEHTFAPPPERKQPEPIVQKEMPIRYSTPVSAVPDEPKLSGTLAQWNAWWDGRGQKIWKGIEAVAEEAGAMIGRVERRTIQLEKDRDELLAMVAELEARLGRLERRP